MNHRSGPHHKIWASASGLVKASQGSTATASSHREAGYSLVALLALMTVLALFALAAAPSIRLQSQREREAEAIFRGEQLAEAIRLYYSYQQRRVGAGDAALPTSIDQLLEGVPVGTKKVQVLRASAARDPLSASGEWRLIRPRSSELADFQRALMVYTENVRPTTTDPQLKQVEQHMAPPVLPTLGIAMGGSNSAGDGSSTGPFIGAASESRNDSVLYYYGIGRHSDWIFTPLFR